MNASANHEHRLEELLDAPLFLVDAYATTSHGSWYEHEVYPAQFFSDIPLPALRQNVNAFREYRELLEQPHMFTVPKVSLELENFREILHDKLVALNEFNRRRGKPSSRHKRLKKAQHDNHSEQKALFEQLTFEAKEIARLASKSHAKGNQGQLASLERIVQHIGDQGNCKRDFSDRYEQTTRPKHDYHTDEQLAATALTLALHEREPVTILTTDSDIQRLLASTTTLLTRTPHRDRVTAQLEQNPITVYLNTGTGYRQTFHSTHSRTKYAPERILPEISEYVEKHLAQD